MPTAAENLQAALDALDQRILVLSAAVKGAYSIDGQSVEDNSQTLLNLIKARKDLVTALDATEGAWEIQTRVVP